MDKLFVVFSIICATNAISVFKNDSSRILNGLEASNDDFPYAASLQRLQSIQETRGHRCGGVLISLQSVLTTASCLHDGTTLIDPAQYRVFAGAAHLNNDTSVDRVRGVANFSIPASYAGPPTHANDIAIINLESPFPSSVVKPLALPSSPTDLSDFETCNFAGWGSTNAANIPSIQLRYENLSHYPPQECYTLYEYRMVILPTMLCATALGKQVVGCTGDAGNALVCKGVLTGILFDVRECQYSVLPLIFTRVSSYTPWIISNSIPDVDSGSASTTPINLTILLVMIVPIVKFYRN